MEFGLSKRVALITGGGQGIGRATALALAAEGCQIVVCDLNEDTMQQTVQEAQARGVLALAVKADVTVHEDIERFVSEAAEKFGRIDILVNNAGTGRLSDLMQLPEAEFRANLDLMLFGPINCAKAVVPYMRQAKWGRIINLSSVFGKQPGGLLDYDAIKAAVIMFTKDLSNYLAKDNILVNAVCPGPIRTPLWEGPGQLGDQLGGMLGMSSQDAIQWYATQNIPLGRYGCPEEIADTIVFPASERASFITGQAINVDGGMVKVCV